MMQVPYKMDTGQAVVVLLLLIHQRYLMEYRRVFRCSPQNNRPHDRAHVFLRIFLQLRTEKSAGRNQRMLLLQTLLYFLFTDSVLHRLRPEGNDVFACLLHGPGYVSLCIKLPYKLICQGSAHGLVHCFVLSHTFPDPSGTNSL